jgi:hypothetical protein
VDGPALKRIHLFNIEDNGNGVIGDEGWRWRSSLNFTIDGQEISEWHYWPIAAVTGNGSIVSHNDEFLDDTINSELIPLLNEVLARG